MAEIKTADRSHDMSREECYDLINGTETFEELKKAILKMGVVVSRNPALNDSKHAYGRDAEKWVRAVEYIERNLELNFHEIMWNMLTRTYGIRQQAMYLFHYSRK